ncbi:MAG: HEAT repeat domain-containing protein [Planctomycetaceae bacterium]|nr:HEAT repeat domain-containing protein [Planctomycetaceae bacterium]
MTRILLVTLFCLALSHTIISERVYAQDNAEFVDSESPSILAKEPQTADEYFDAVLLMVRVARPDLANRYLTTLLEQEPDDETLLRLRDEHGTATFLRLANDEDLRPLSQELLSRLQAAAGNQLNDPARFDEIMVALSGDPREREQAIRDLKHYGPNAIPELLQRLSGSDHQDTYDLLLLTLVKYGPAAIDPLLGAIEAPDPGTRAIAIEALGWLGNEDIVPRLWYPALAVDQPPVVQSTALQAISRIRFGDAHLFNQLDPVGATAEIADRAIVHFRGAYDWASDIDGVLTVWSWDPEQNRLVGTTTTPLNASTFMAERLARQAMLMSPENVRYRALFLATTMAHERIRAGWDQAPPQGPGTAHQLALVSGPGLTESALWLAVENGNPASALVALSVLSEIGTRDQLVRSTDRPPAIIAALDFPNDRVQFAAAMAVLGIAPSESFPHASRVIEILSRSLMDEGGPRSVIIDPNVRRGVDTASMLNRLGFTTSVAKTGREGFNQAIEHGDLALAVLHPNTIRWELTQTVANFRADSRTAGVPLVIAAPEPARFDMERFLHDVPASGFVSTGGEADDWQRQLDPVLAQVNAPPLTSEQHQARIEAAASALRYIGQSQLASVFNLAPAEEPLSETINHPVAGRDAIIALGAIGQPSVQRRLLDVILAPAFDADLRDTAARELLSHMRRHGRLLTAEEVTAVTNAWQGASEVPLQSTLSGVVGSLNPDPESVFDMLQAHPLPATPLP